ncbi:MAG: 50S ribosomal protein L29 [Deltaproteobacteria bacterium]|nr:50S ribosomal protein L29 [Deltaproteobacteria bacterium]
MSKENKLTNSLSLEELKTKGSELEGQLFKLRMQKATGQLANTSLVSAARKELARVKTFQTQKLSQPAKSKAAQKTAKGK